jgi:hypothetical protein
VLRSDACLETSVALFAGPSAEAYVPPPEGRSADSPAINGSGGLGPPESIGLKVGQAAIFCTTLIDSGLRPATANSKTRAPSTASAAIMSPIPA